ncbi:MAG: hypothetical protein J6T35_08755 [Bacteroidales bacterium]|nr:hypothetical protein [Bacteroidales bacterium]
MRAENLRIIAARLREMGQALQVLAGQVEAEAPHLGVNLPRDLFSDLDEPQPQLFEGIRKALDEAVEDAKIVGPGKAPAPRKTWKRVGCRMQDTAIVAAEKVGRRSGWCQRSDIERSLQRRNSEYTREAIREAVNYAVREGGYMCVKYNSYRFYRTADRGLIIAAALAKLCAG